jgi:CBS domain-containing protein/sporulation protein YlmC with PRC-barrel domain
MVAVVEPEFFLSEVIRRRVYRHSEKVGRLQDLVIVETGKLPEVVQLVINRPYGQPALLVPWDKVVVISTNEIAIDVESLEAYQTPPAPGAILLRDYILDKKILDMDGREVEVVYDVKLAFQGGKLYASEVDFSRHRLLRRLGLRHLANFMAQQAGGDSTVSWMYVQPLPDDLGSFSGSVKLNVLKSKVHEIHPVDLADILEELDSGQRQALFNQLEPEHASETLEEIEPRVQRELMATMQHDRAAKLIGEMSPAQAADILAILPAHDADGILALLDADDAAKVRRIVEHHDENILLFATQACIRLPADAVVRDVLSGYRELAQKKDVLTYMYIVDAQEHLLGVVGLRDLVSAGQEQTLGALMTEQLITLSPDETLRDAVQAIARYGLRAIPVVDDERRLRGVVSDHDVRGLKPRLA